jgi:glycine C-acetyltransferase/8-amino-7-oxononanoate synthase
VKTILEFIEEELNSLKESGLYRFLKTIRKTDGRIIEIDGKEYLNFCSNNYLGLSNHPKVIEAAQAACKEFGAGCGASRLITGNTILHAELENRIAKFKGREAAIVFPTGYMANLGAITSLVDENDTVIIDRLDHASIIDACRLSRAKLQVYPHKDMKALEKILGRAGNFKKRLIVTDSVFSMDGDLAPLPEIISLAKEYNAITMIDEAHATGIIGPNGKGLEEHFGLEGKTDIIMGTLSKSVGSLGGFIAGSAGLIDYLRNKAHSFIYTTALPPSACAAAIAALDIIESQPALRGKLWENIKHLTPLIPLSIFDGEGETRREGVRIESPIIPIIIGDAKKTVEISELLMGKGIFLSAIRPPTVPEGSSRLRLTVTAMHNKEDLECLVSSLQGRIPVAGRPT